MTSSRRVRSLGVSIVVPNARCFPQTLVERLRSQAVEGDEIIVVQNRPRSGTRHWVGIAANAPSLMNGSAACGWGRENRWPTVPASSAVPIYVLRSNEGAAAARNRGWYKAKNDAILFLDDDVLVGGSFLREVRRSLTWTATAGVVTFRVQSMSSGVWSNLIRSTISLDRGPEVRSTGGSALSLQDVWKFGAGAAMLVERSALTATGGFKEHLGAGRNNGGTEDAEFLWHASRHVAIEYNGQISVLHEDVSSLVGITKKLRQYGRAIGNLGGATRSAEGYHYVAGYCLHLIRAVTRSKEMCNLPAGCLAWARGAVVIAVVETLRTYVSYMIRSRRGDILCPNTCVTNPEGRA